MRRSGRGSRPSHNARSTSTRAGCLQKISGEFRICMIYEQLQMSGLPSSGSTAERSPSYRQGFRASLIALREKVAAIVTSVTCGARLQELSERSVRSGSSVRIRPVFSQEVISGTSVECSMTLPRWGIRLAGEYGALATSEHRTSGIACSLWRTPMASDGIFSERRTESLAQRWENQKKKHLSEQVAYVENHGGGADFSGNLLYTDGVGRGANEASEQRACTALDQKGRGNKPCGTDSASRGVSHSNSTGQQEHRIQRFSSVQSAQVCSHISYANGIGELQPQGEQQESGKRACDGRILWQWWEAEPDVGRVADGVSARVDRLRCLGNAVVPQQVYPIFRAIADYEKSV